MVSGCAGSPTRRGCAARRRTSADVPVGIQPMPSPVQPQHSRSSSPVAGASRSRPSQGHPAAGLPLPGPSADALLAQRRHPVPRSSRGSSQPMPMPSPVQPNIRAPALTVAREGGSVPGASCSWSTSPSSPKPDIRTHSGKKLATSRISRPQSSRNPP
jgi:hypothetical protein